MLRKTGGIIVVALVAVVLLGAFGGITMGAINEIAGFNLKTVNEANFFKVGEYDIVDTTDEDADIKIDVTEDGVINIEGKHKGEEALEILVDTVTLTKGDYVLKSHAKRDGEDRYQLILKDAADGKIVADAEFTVESDTTYTAYIVIQPDVKVDVEFSPVLVEDGEKTGFYVYDWNIFND